MAINYGRQSTETPLQANRYFDVTETIFLKRPDEAPFTALSIALEKARKTTGDPEFKWFNKDIRPQAVLATSASALGASTIEVADASIFLVNDVIQVLDVTTGLNDNVQHLVTAVNLGTNVLTIVRNAWGSTDVAIAIGDTILRVGNAHEEGSALPPPSAMRLQEFKNYTQIFRHSSIYSRTFFESNKWHAGNLQKELQTRREEKRREHKREIESAFLFGQRGIQNAGAENVRRTTGGLYYWLDQAAVAGVDNRQNVAGGGALSYAVFSDFLAGKGFAYGGEEKWGFASREVVAVLSLLIKDHLRVQNHVTSFGLNVTTFETTAGILHIVRHDLMRFGKYRNDLLVIDPSHLDIRYMGDSMSRFKTDVGLESNDRSEDGWLTEAGLQVAVPESLASLGNIVSAV